MARKKVPGFTSAPAEATRTKPVPLKLKGMAFPPALPGETPTQADTLKVIRRLKKDMERAYWRK